MGIRLSSSLLFLAFSFTLLPLQAQNQAKAVSEETAQRALLHQGSEWQLVEAHLPDPKVASATQLETTADVLRARRFLYDAIDFYRYALERGGDVPRLMNRMGMVELELRHQDLARAYFLRGAQLQPKNAQYWNNAGAAEFLAGNLQASLHDYNRAVKLEKKNAVFHSNLGTAYFEMKDYESARKQFDIAFHYDPHLYQRHDGSGIEARVFSSTDHGRFCFELARVSARGHDDANVIAWLTKATESGFDIQSEMGSDKLLLPYRKDPRVLLIIQNARALRSGRTIATAPVPPLPDKPTGPKVD